MCGLNGVVSGNDCSDLQPTQALHQRKTGGGGMSFSVEIIYFPPTFSAEQTELHPMSCSVTVCSTATLPLLKLCRVSVAVGVNDSQLERFTQHYGGGSRMVHMWFRGNQVTHMPVVVGPD